MNEPFIAKCDGEDEAGTISALISIIQNQILHIDKRPAGFNDLIMWICETNGYVSCHFYDAVAEIIDESESYSVAHFSYLHEELLEIGGESFETRIMRFLKQETIVKLLRNALTEKLTLYVTDDSNEPERLYSGVRSRL